MIGFVRTYPNFITNLAPRFRWQLLHIFIQTEIHGTFILLFANFYRCHFNGAVFGVIIYWLSIFGSILRYWVLPWTVNCFHILVSVVRFHLSQTLDFPSFSVEYSVMSFVSNSSLWNANTVTCLPMSIICIRDTTISSIHTFMSGPLMNTLTYFPYIRSPLTNILRPYCDILSVFFIISRAFVDMYSARFNMSVVTWYIRDQLIPIFLPLFWSLSPISPKFKKIDPIHVFTQNFNLENFVYLQI